jgi:N-hydroxyarylamine O-acetyltransferase
MSDHALDLDGYFARIGYRGPREATRATLFGLHQHHTRAIPFENLDVLLGRPVRLESESIAQKLIRDRRGGYCFEQNALLRDALRALGFRVTPLIARVRWQKPDDVPTPPTHMLLQVGVEGRDFIADVGFGSKSLAVPLELQLDREQPGSLEPRRLVQRGSVIVQQTRDGEEWKDLYAFRLEEAPSVDFELGNWFTSTHPESHFKLNLVAARMGDGCRYALLNREFTTRYADGRVEKRDLTTPDELLAVLADTFGLRFPAGTRFGPADAPWPV